MGKKTRRTVDDIFDDLDSIGKRKPSAAELYPEDFEDNNLSLLDSGYSQGASSVGGENCSASCTSPPSRKQARFEDHGGTTKSSLAATPTPLAHSTGSKQQRAGGASPMTICGSPTMSDASLLDGSPAFASELTTAHRKAEEAADLAVFLADSIGQSPTFDGLEQLIKHLTLYGARYVLRSLRIGGLLRQFMKGFLNDKKYAKQRSDDYHQVYLRLLQLFVCNVPHDAVPMEHVFQSIVKILCPACAHDDVAVDGAQIRARLPSSGSLAASAALMSNRVPAAKASHCIDSQPPSDAKSKSRIVCALQGVASNLEASQPNNDNSQPSDLGDVQADLSTSALHSSHALVLDIATKLLLSHNNAQFQVDGFAVRSLSNVISKSAAVLFLEAGGVAAILSFLRKQTLGRGRDLGDPDPVLVAFRLLVLVTCDPEIVAVVSRDASLLSVLESLMAFCMNAAATGLPVTHRDDAPTVGYNDRHQEERLEAVRVVINLTSVLPELIPTSLNSKVLVQACEWAQRHLKLIHPTAPIADGDDDFYDAITLGVCLAINLIRKGANVEAVCCLTKLGDEDLEELTGSSMLSHAANVMVHWYESTDTRQSVMAGYIAMMLACISLCETDVVDFRVAVITAIANGLKKSSAARSRVSAEASPENSQQETPVETFSVGSSFNESCTSSTSVKERQLRTKPMMLVVAILQEFVLFQSTAGVLDKDVLVMMHYVVEKLIESNGIVVEPSA